MNIGTAIKEVRKQKNFSQIELAEQIGISQTSLSQIESGNKRPSSNTLKKVCEVLKVSELLLYVMSASEEDIPEEKKEIFNMLFPSIKGLVLQITQDKSNQ
ncbi:MAG: helix-turn-helix transcriptional regulator [Bacteroidetes bacterium]|nr:helix-turn-helix transcriptional regulator [Bacteroidota bacterium]